ncbi:hypothetical protein [Microscilla marina]|uniref:Uncharacterized protein n=1 Tax=Microscilla marina ATCC 23134 TaxID=313606 RepID=A1ZHJ9_MICM2|nr:hypothetical protein [Microscilla marina]EAY30006.1 hypothetical protein M23134_05339 [Microscilla marina ATCC 23134]
MSNLSETCKARGFDRAWRHCPRRKYGFSGVYSPKDPFIRKPWTGIVTCFIIFENKARALLAPLPIPHNFTNLGLPAAQNYMLCKP